jgi:hypothetical protein
MTDETYPGEEQLLINAFPKMNRGKVYFHPTINELVQFTGNKVYFRPQVFWHAKDLRENKGPRIRTKAGLIRLLRRHGYRYIGEL